MKNAGVALDSGAARKSSAISATTTTPSLNTHAGRRSEAPSPGKEPPIFAFGRQSRLAASKSLVAAVPATSQPQVFSSASKNQTSGHGIVVGDDKENTSGMAYQAPRQVASASRGLLRNKIIEAGVDASFLTGIQPSASVLKAVAASSVTATFSTTIPATLTNAPSDGNADSIAALLPIGSSTVSAKKAMGRTELTPEPQRGSGAGWRCNDIPPSRPTSSLPHHAEASHSSTTARAEMTCNSMNSSNSNSNSAMQYVFSEKSPVGGGMDITADISQYRSIGHEKYTKILAILRKSNEDRSTTENLRVDCCTLGTYEGVDVDKDRDNRKIILSTQTWRIIVQSFFHQHCVDQENHGKKTTVASFRAALSQVVVISADKFVRHWWKEERMRAIRAIEHQISTGNQISRPPPTIFTSRGNSLSQDSSVGDGNGCCKVMELDPSYVCGDYVGQRLGSPPLPLRRSGDNTSSEDSNEILIGPPPLSSSDDVLGANSHAVARSNFSDDRGSFPQENVIYNIIDKRRTINQHIVNNLRMDVATVMQLLELVKNSGSQSSSTNITILIGPSTDDNGNSLIELEHGSTEDSDKSLLEFDKDDRVSFNSRGKEYRGTVIRLVKRNEYEVYLDNGNIVQKKTWNMKKIGG